MSETLSGVYKFKLMRHVYIYIYVWRYVCRMPLIRNVGGVRPQPISAVSNEVTNGNSTGTKETIRFGLNLVSSLCLRNATTVAKVKLFSTWTWSTVSFYSV